MYTQRSLCTLFLLVLAALGSFGTGKTQADPITITYEVTVNTSSVGVPYGYLDFQLNPGAGVGVPLPATATITNFSTDGTLNPSAPFNGTLGDVTNSLPGTPSNPLTIDNGVNNNSGFNDYFEGFTFGSTIGFDVTLLGAALNSPGLTNVGSSFAFTLYAGDAQTQLLSFGGNGSVLTINVNPDSTTSVETFPQSSTDNTPAASAFLVPQLSVPAPSSFVLFLIAAPAGLVYWRRSSAKRR